MLGSTSSGERDNAARLAEQFRQRLGVTWEEMLASDHVADDPAPPRQENRPEPTQRGREEPAQPPLREYQQASRPAGRNSFSWSRVVFVVLTCGTIFGAELAAAGAGSASLATWMFSAQSVNLHGRSPPPMSLTELVSSAERGFLEVAHALGKK
jgi:hypothetical protein